MTELNISRNRKEHLISCVRGGIVKMPTEEKEHIVAEQNQY